ncbi:hypothetical protein LTR27_001234 [Elasticomyces elasticus]|nr:hypothetical protein LTR27_001234 [Elasticomyces elasticus]
MAAFTNLRQRIVLHPEPGSFTAEGESARWSNKDLDPVPQENKKWEWYHVGGFWIAEGFNVAQLETPSSAVALGLNPGLAMVACLIGNLLVTLPTMSSAYLGSKYGLNFPVISRASFGMRGALNACHSGTAECLRAAAIGLTLKSRWTQARDVSQPGYALLVIEVPANPYTHHL